MRCVIILLILISVTLSANILGITTVLSHSHHLWNEILSLELVKNGHNVTLLSHDDMKKTVDNYTVLFLDGVYETLFSGDFNLEDTIKKDKALSTAAYWAYTELACKLDLGHKSLQTLLNYPKDYTFDLVLWDATAGECLIPLIKRFGNPPVVLTSPFGLQPTVSEMMGSHIYNYVPFYGLEKFNANNFWHRLENTFYLYYMVYQRWQHVERMRGIMEEVFGDDVDEPDDVMRKYTIALVNSDPVLDYPQPMPPNIINVGGLQVKPAKPLPKGIQQVYDKAKNGVIYFSLGSNLKSEQIDKSFLRAFTECFETLPYTILWKIEAPDVNLPNNVFMEKWCPQNDILANPKTILFITHGGALSTHESIYHGVPMVGLPFFLDQSTNIDKLVSRNVAVRLDTNNMTPNGVCITIKEAIQNKKYTENVKLMSSRVKDQPDTPLQRAVFWIEYVLRHGTAEHLSIAPRDMTFIQSANLDIIGFLLLITIIPCFLLVCLCMRICKGSNGAKQKLS